ncbi:hypothetical protein [Psittacicella hinzii]|uniref:Uncharacterized protein n=1 Tax=Psittacicella hinzii TaxID=2028575 RepID=A0A3A1YG96_9GAMM|nr:hypothetical protein [Psittacicella hinzii]RIY36208.1 hypothetical protein CKF58_06095 [Psittacicella hinzii]
MSGNPILDLVLIATTYGLSAVFLSFSVVVWRQYIKNDSYDLPMLYYFTFAIGFAVALAVLSTLTLIKFY